MCCSQLGCRQYEFDRNSNLPLIFTGISFLALSPQTFAAQDLSVENLFTDEGRIRLESTISYANSERQSLALGEPFVIQTGPTSYVTLPTTLTERNRYTDAVVATAAMRFGLTHDAEVYGRGSWLNSDTRVSGTASSESQTLNQFASSWLGFNYRLKEETDAPTVIGFAEIALSERQGWATANGKSYLLGLTAYKVLDPVVLTLTAAAGLNSRRYDGRSNYKPGNTTLISFATAFAANERVSLTTGLQWRLRHADRLDNAMVGVRRASTDLILGVGYGLSTRTTINFSATSNISGTEGASARLTIMHTLGKSGL